MSPSPGIRSSEFCPDVGKTKVPVGTRGARAPGPAARPRGPAPRPRPASMRFCRAKTAESATKGAKRRSGQDAAPLAADDQPQCSSTAASGTARWQQEQVKDPYRRQRTPLWKRTSKAAPRPAPEPQGLDAVNGPAAAAGDVQTIVPSSMQKPSKPFRAKTPAVVAPAPSVSDTALESEEVEPVELVHREQQTSCTSVYEGEVDTVLEGYGVELPVDDQAPSPPPGPSRPADDRDDDDDSDTDDSATDEAVGSTPSTAVGQRSSRASRVLPLCAANLVHLQTVCTSAPEAVASDRLSVELKALVSMVETTAGSPVRCTSSTRASTTTTAAPREAGRRAEQAAPAETGAAEGDGEGLRTWQRNFLGRLTRARQRRDIRINRKEVLSMQLMLETVLKQHMALSREVEAVKANMQREGVEPVSLSRALSRLQAERTEEAAALDKILACKDRELRGAQSQLEQARRQIGILEQSCREKDADLERAATALATVHSMHRKGMELANQKLQEQLDALRAAHAEAEAETAARHQADLAGQLADLRKATQAELEAAAARHAEREAELQARLSTLRTDAAAKESRLEMESLRMSRALTEREAHVSRLMTTVEQLQLQLRDARAEAAAAGAALRAARADQEEAAVLVSKALSARDLDAQQAREAAEAARREHESQLQALRTAAEVLRSQQDVQELAYKHALNEKDLCISGMLIDQDALRAALADTEARLAEAKEANAGLLKTAEAMNGQQEELTRQLRHSFGQLEAQAAQLQAQAAQLEMQAGQLDAQAAEAEQLRVALAQAQGDADEARRAYKDVRTEAERLRRAQQEAAAERDRLRTALNDLHASSEAELARLQRALRDHQHDAEELVRLQRALDKLRTSSAAEAEALRKEMQGLHDNHVAELTRVQEALLEAKDKRRAEAEHFRKALHEKDVQIRDIQDEFAKFRLDQEEAHGELQARRDALDKEVGVLKNSVSQMKSAHRERVSALDKKAGELAEQARRHRQDAEQARAELRDQQQRVREAERARVQADQALAALEERLSDLVRHRDQLLQDAEHLAKQRDNCQVYGSTQHGNDARPSGAVPCGFCYILMKQTSELYRR
ncbi:Laminin subunit alpha-3 [Frankliniella fusca]|uniref:Laminin subunit alpha-3 n=1 Tax=Frankliniella fusca TaxID=407009 RepID=A0AAE1LNS8_9NEOP|nr:Laminin subunit alpha-3 [Frankliniella fusca]